MTLVLRSRFRPLALRVRTMLSLVLDPRVYSERSTGWSAQCRLVVAPALVVVAPVVVLRQAVVAVVAVVAVMAVVAGSFGMSTRALVVEGTDTAAIAAVQVAPVSVRR